MLSASARNTHATLGDSDDDDYDEPFSNRNTPSACTSPVPRALSADDFRGGSSKPAVSRVLSLHRDLADVERSLSSNAKGPSSGQQKIVVKANSRVRMVAVPKPRLRNDANGASGGASNATGGAVKKAMIPKQPVPHRNSSSTSQTDKITGTDEYLCLDSSSVDQSVYTSRTSSAGLSEDLRTSGGQSKSSSRSATHSTHDAAKSQSVQQITTPKGQLKANLSSPPEYSQAMAPNPNFKSRKTASLTPSYAAEARGRGAVCQSCRNSFSRRTTVFLFGASLLVSLSSLLLSILLITEVIVVGERSVNGDISGIFADEEHDESKTSLAKTGQPSVSGPLEVEFPSQRSKIKGMK